MVWRQRERHTQQFRERQKESKIMVSGVKKEKKKKIV